MYIQQQKNKALLVKIKYILVKNIEKIKLVSEQASKANKQKIFTAGPNYRQYCC